MQEIEQLVARLGTTSERLAAVLERESRHLPVQRWYVFRGPPGAGSAAAGLVRPRTVVAFVSADEALGWAQVNHVGPPVRVRLILALELLRRMLATPTIGSVLFAQTDNLPPIRGSLPPGTRVTRERLIRELDEQHS